MLSSAAPLPSATGEASPAEEIAPTAAVPRCLTTLFHFFSTSEGKYGTAALLLVLPLLLPLLLLPRLLLLVVRAPNVAPMCACVQAAALLRPPYNRNMGGRMQQQKNSIRRLKFLLAWVQRKRTLDVAVTPPCLAFSCSEQRPYLLDVSYFTLLRTKELLGDSVSTLLFFLSFSHKIYQRYTHTFRYG